MFNLNSCKEDEVLLSNNSFELNQLLNSNIIVGDTIILKGNFPNLTSNFKIILKSIDSNYTIPTNQIINNSNSTLEFIYPYDFIGDSIFIVFKSNNKNDTTQSIYTKITSYFTFAIIPIQTTNFKIGSNFGLSDELPVSNVQLSHKLEVSTYEINQRTWYSVMLKNNSSSKNFNLPVDSIDWIDAIIFCNELSKKFNYSLAYNIKDTLENIVEWDTTSNGWRLPTEAEWEFLAKGNTLDDTFENKQPDEVGWFLSNSGIKLNPSGLKSKNINGLYDMNGNVWEWCWDNYNSEYYNQINNSKNPKGPKLGSRKVKRGGAFNSGSFFIRASNRSIVDNNLIGTGLRVVRNLNFE